MTPTQLLLCETISLRTPSEGRGFPNARDVTLPDSNRRLSERLMRSINRACAEHSLTVKESTQRFELDHRRYFTGLPDVDLVTTIAASASAAGVMISLIKATGPVLLQWMKNRASRSVRVRVNNRQIEIRGTKDLAAVVKALADLDATATKTTRQRRTPQKSRKKRKGK